MPVRADLQLYVRKRNSGYSDSGSYWSDFLLASVITGGALGMGDGWVMLALGV